ncbi:hypothetical protein CDD81_171 [Ophiocordyceps australis]|uniref:Uncharacterized protein n=1 Tax=Ophiocordyceps australis TaxID=1399860 RepID=A0A2C5XL24_9HYPO|nr:hypothetical protein CDD81_171 [Ophiocordyceps australis]
MKVLAVVLVGLASLVAAERRITPDITEGTGRGRNGNNGQPAPNGGGGGRPQRPNTLHIPAGPAPQGPPGPRVLGPGENPFNFPQGNNNNNNNNRPRNP